MRAAVERGGPLANRVAGSRAMHIHGHAPQATGRVKRLPSILHAASPPGARIAAHQSSIGGGTLAAAVMPGAAGVSRARGA